MDQSPNSRKKPVIVGIATVAVIAVLVFVIAAANKKPTDNSGAVTMGSGMSNIQAASSNTGATQASSLKDGTYVATGSYDSPGGTESITISVTLKNGTITDTSAMSGANDHDAQEFQNQFIASYKSSVVGKPINGMRMGRVSGSSLTAQGFNNALSQIIQQAQG